MSVSEVTEPRLFVPSLARGLSLLAYALSLGTIWDTLCCLLPGALPPPHGWTV